jgi:hypothetical protein
MNRLRATVAAALAFGAIVASGLGAPVARAAARAHQTPSSPVSVYPTPGDKYEQPGTQITFRGIAAADIGGLTVVGSASGLHPGQIEADSDGDGGSFIPTTPFSPGETVTVTTELDIVGATNGTFQFTIDQPAPNLVPEALPDATGPDSTQQFHSAPSLQPARVIVTKDTAPASEGDIFVAPQFGPTQNGPMILDPYGNLVWFDPIPIAAKQIVTDFREQELDNQPVLTWFQGTTTAGTGAGVGVIMNDHYQQIATVHAGNGLQMDLHEFLVSNGGDAWIIAVAPVDLPGVLRPVLNSVVQEIDIATGLVLFQWDALDHVSLSSSYLYGPKVSGRVLDPYHANSVSLDAAGNPVVSLRNTYAVYDIDRASGATNWVFGGNGSTFKLGPGAATALQHDAVVQPSGDLTIFDDGAGPPKVHSQSRGIEVALNSQTNTATLVRQVTHSPSLLADFEGNVQVLSDGSWFLGWGQQPYFSEYNSSGVQDFDAHFATGTSSYRAYRFSWSGAPATNPALAVGTTPAGEPELWESWNGATDVAGWRVFEGPSSHEMQLIGAHAKRKFESTLEPATGERDVQVQAIGYAGNVIGTSPVQTVPNHVQLFGAEAFAPTTAGLTSVPVGCYSTTTCKLSATVADGTTVLAQSGQEGYAPGTAGLLYFQLSAAALATIAKSGPISATITVKDAGGARTATAPFELNSFTTSGAGPARSSTSSAGLAIVGGTTFVSATKGTGGVLVDCRSSVPCPLTTTITSGTTVIATTKREWIGADQLGYLFFSLTTAGQALLSHAAGNQLAAAISVAGPHLSAASNSALVAYR